MKPHPLHATHPAPVLQRQGMGWREMLAASLIGIGSTTLRAVILGQDVNWDLRNYQYYAVWAWIHERVTFHIAPAQVQTWLNPFVFLPHYLLIHHAPSIVAGAAFGTMAGINFVLVYAITRRIVQGEGRYLAMAVSLLCALVGITGPEFAEQVGSTCSDLIISIPVLAGLLSICRSLGNGTTSRAKHIGYFAAGLLLGAACGLKLTCIVYAAGLTLSLVVLWPKLKFGALRFSLYAAGGVLGFLLTGGYWSWFLWRTYGNPIFPYYNALFRSPWAAADNFRDMRFLPVNAGAAILLPFQWLAGLNPTSESQFRDARFAFLSVLLPLGILALLWRRGRRTRSNTGSVSAGPLVGGEHFWLLVIFFVTSYVLWIKMFAIQRYLMPIGLISGVLLFLILDRLLLAKTNKVAVFAALALFSMGWDKSFPSERLPFGKDWWGVELTPAVSLPDTLFIMIGDAPMSYVVPFLPPSAQVVRLSGNMPLQPGTRLGRQAMDVIAEQTGPIRSLSAIPLAPADRSQLSRFGLALDPGQCETFRSRVEEFTSCVMIRQAPRPPAPPAKNPPG